MRKNKKLLLTAAVSAALFVGGLSPAFAASIPNTYTENGVTYTHYYYETQGIPFREGLLTIYYNDEIKGYALVVYKDNTYTTVSESETGTYAKGENIIGRYGGETASVSGGENNKALYTAASVSGGWGNTASGDRSSVSGGSGNIASDSNTSVSGGYNNKASNSGASVSGGKNNTAGGPQSSVSGGENNKASGFYSSVSGGKSNTADGESSSVSGGYQNTANNWYSSVSGGMNNTANGANSSVSGGYGNIASGQYSSVSGGDENTASGQNSSVSGGQNNSASGDRSSVSGGYQNTASGICSSAFGGQKSHVKGNYSTGIAGGFTGENAINSLAAGYRSVVTVENGIAIGYQATTNKNGTIAFGHDVGDENGYINYSSAYYNRLVKIADGIDAHDAVTVEQLNKAVASAGGGAAYTAGSDIDISSANAISVKKAGLIASGNTGIVTGGTVYSTTNALNTQITATSQAVESLSDKISTYGKTISSISTSVTNTLSSMKNTQANFVDTSLSNISSDGKDVIKQVVKDVLAANTASTTSSPASAKNANLLKASFVAAPMRAAANLTAGDHVNISGNTISVKADGTVASGNMGLVTGGAVYDAVKDKADKSYVDEGLAKKADISYVDQGLSQKVNVSDFTPVKQQVETNTSDISALKTGKADVDGSNINVGSYTTKLNTGKVEKGNTGLVSGGIVYDSLQTKADVGYVNTMGLALDSEIKGTAQGLHNEIQDMGNRLTKDINRVGAGSAALAALHPQDFNPDDKWDFAVGYGHYKNANASAVGAFYRPNAGTTVSLAATIGNGDPQVSAGVSFKIGMGKNVEKVMVNKDDYDKLNQKVESQAVENQEMKEALVNQNKKIQELEEAVKKLSTK